LKLKRLGLFLARNALLGLALLATLTLSAIVTMRVVLSAQDVQVPNLVGRRAGDAQTLAGSRRLTVRVEGKRHDPRVPFDHVVAQEPAGGSTLKTHRSVRVWLSLGPRRLSVPSIEGESVRTARVALDQAQVPVARIVEVDDNAPEGTVIGQHPPAGETEDVGEGVSLLVSRGPGSVDYLMPDLIGRNAQDVIDRLRLAGLKVTEIRYRGYPGVAPGIVLRQLPPAGYRINRRGSVSLDVSKADS
jgi:serine/threonine-protein kinase